MTANPWVATRKMSLKEAAQLMSDGGFHQLPVIENDMRLVGIVTDRDIRSASGYDESLQTNLRVEEIMTANLITINQDATLEEAVTLFCTRRFGSLPVVDHEKLIGIITRHDILKAFHDLLGFNLSGSRIEIAIPNGASDIANAMQAIPDDTELLGVVAARLRQDGEEPVLYLRTSLINPWQIERQLRANGAILLAPELSPKTL